MRDYNLFLQASVNLGAKLAPHPQVVRLHDYYVDTPERFFQKAQLACRIRINADSAEFTLKNLVESKRKVFIREEKNIKLPKLASEKAALAYCQNKFFPRLQLLFVIKHERQIHHFFLPGRTRLEASYDQVVMSCGKKKHQMQEIELEFKSGLIEQFEAFIDKLSTLPLRCSTSSKFEVALTHFQKELSPSLSSKWDAFHDLANHVLKDNRKAIKKCEREVSLGQPDAIHDMRVATRRLRAALKTFKRALPAKAKKIRAKLQTLFRVLGEKRDLDVFSEFISSTLKAKTDAFPALSKRIDEAHHHIISLLQSRLYVGLVEALEQLEAVEIKSDQENLQWMQRRILKALEKVLKGAGDLHVVAEDKDLHQLRISIKKLRYICEFFEPIFSKYVCSLELLIKKCKQFQTILGAHQDAIAGLAMLNRHKSLMSSKEFTLLQNEYHLQKQHNRELFFKKWKSFWFGEGFRKSNPTTALELILG